MLIFVAVLCCLESWTVQLYYINDTLLFDCRCGFFTSVFKKYRIFKIYYDVGPSCWNVLVILLAGTSDCRWYNNEIVIYFINSFWWHHVVFSWFTWSKNGFVLVFLGHGHQKLLAENLFFELFCVYCCFVIILYATWCWFN